MTSIFTEPSYLWRQAARHHSWRAERQPARECDLAIVGSGAAGLAAAFGAAQKGESVVILEAQSQPGGLFAQNGGIVQDGFESSIQHIKRRFDENEIPQLLRISHEGLATVRDISEAVKGGFEQTGYIVAFRNEAQYEEYKKYIAYLLTSLPDIYRQTDFEDLDARQIIGGRYYHYGGIYSKHGGVMNTPELVFGLLDYLSQTDPDTNRKKFNVQLVTNALVKELEPAPRRGVRLYFERRGVQREIVARRAILTGDTNSLFPGSIPAETAATGMFAITELPDEIIEMAARSSVGGVPHIGSETIAPYYYRFMNDVHGLTLLFGASARIGKGEEQFTLRDIETGLINILPPMAKPTNRQSIRAATKWARRLAFSHDDLPMITGYNPATRNFVWFDGLPYSAKGSPPHIPVIYVGGFAGQGNNLALHLGLAAGRYDVHDFATLKAFNRPGPQKPVPRRVFHRRAAAERSELN